MAIDPGGMVARAAELLTDEEFDFWERGFHERSVAEAVCIISEVLQSALDQDCVDMTFNTQAGAAQQLPDAVDGRFKAVVANQSGRTIREYERQQLDNLIPCWGEQTDAWRGYVEFWTRGGCEDQSFYLYPPPPAGHAIRIRLMQDADEMTAEDLDCRYESVILDYLLWRAFEREGSENANKWQGYRQSFWDQLSVYKAQEQERILRDAGCYDRLCKEGAPPPSIQAGSA
ncbi:MAG: hypothetical protein KDI44_02610 [Thiothrix sp.]|nr:hypothetical protein [Thiothrix sp.]HPQ94187.1 hypothetical protein [Thiolinea sp.]